MNELVGTLAVVGMKIDFKGGFQNVWNIIKSAAPALAPLMTTLGILVVAFGIAKYVWDRKKGGGGNTMAFAMTILVGMLLAGPETIFPPLLGIVDSIANMVVGFIS